MQTLTSLTFTQEQIKALQRKARSKRDFQKVQIVVLKSMRYKHDQIEVCAGVSHDNISRTLVKYRSEGADALFEDLRGGRKNENMTEKEEKAFLKPFLKQAERGGVLIVREIHRAYSATLGKKTPLSTVYAMLHRNGWRKISPRPKHPKGDEEKQQAFKVIFPLRRTKSRPQG